MVVEVEPGEAAVVVGEEEEEGGAEGEAEECELP